MGETEFVSTISFSVFSVVKNKSGGYSPPRPGKIVSSFTVL